MVDILADPLLIFELNVGIFVEHKIKCFRFDNELINHSISY
jgi:hypothetical protein